MRSTEVSATERPQDSRAPTLDPSAIKPQALSTTPDRPDRATIAIDGVPPMNDWAGLPLLLAFMLAFGPDVGSMLFWGGVLLFAVIPRLYTTGLRRGWAHTTTVTLLTVSGIWFWANLPWLSERVTTWWTLVRGYLT